MTISVKTALAAMTLLAGTAAQAVAPDEIAYAGRSPAFNDKAYLVTLLADRRAEVVTDRGRASGAVSSQGQGVRRIAFDAPTTSTAGEYDSCGEWAQVRTDVTQLVFRRLDGTPKGRQQQRDRNRCAVLAGWL